MTRTAMRVGRDGTRAASPCLTKYEESSDSVTRFQMKSSPGDCSGRPSVMDTSLSRQNAGGVLLVFSLPFLGGGGGVKITGKNKNHKGISDSGVDELGFFFLKRLLDSEFLRVGWCGIRCSMPKSWRATEMTN